MKLTPDDIAVRVFSSKIFGGYSRKEISAFLERVAADYEELLQKNAQLQEQLCQKENQLKEYKAREDLLREAITTAQQTAQNMQVQAETTARDVVEEAHRKADLITQDARDSLKAVYQDLSNLRRVHLQLKNTMKAVLQSHQDLLEQDPVHTLLPKLDEDSLEGIGDLEDRVEKKLSELSKTKDLL